MRATAYVGVSVDGFLARPDDALDFLPPPPDGEGGFPEFLATVDGIVLGRRTFEVVLRHPEWPYGRKPVVVLSRTLRELRAPAGAACERMEGAPRDVLDRLAQRGWRLVYVDGGRTIQEFLAAGLLDRLVITRVPVLIGQGVPLFGKLPRDIALEHEATRTFANGMVKSAYRVLPRPA